MKKMTCLLLAGLLLTGTLAGGCQRIPAARGAGLLADVEAASWPDQAPRPSSELTDAVNHFAWDLLEHSIDEGNRLISPASVWLALAMTLNGAAGSTYDELADVLSVPGLSGSDRNLEARNWQIGLRNLPEPTRLDIANSIWYHKDYQPASPFMQSTAAAFDAEIHRLDFADPAAIETINGWVSQMTEGAIDSIINEIDVQTMMYLINAVYFKGDWSEPFDAVSTRDRPFMTEDGSVEVPFMHSQRSIRYIDADGVLGVVLPYKDQRTAMVALLPRDDESPADLVSQLSDGRLTGWVEQAETGMVDLALPKFTIEDDLSLVKPLAAMGLIQAFDSNSADFSAMSASGTRDLFIGEVRHKTFIRVDELGTEAAAVTSVEMRATGMPVYDLTVSFDRPFVYVLLDLDSAAPLFIGLLENPA
ncbi:MAG: serpin family protein [Eubacteriales bacterium]|nr:serpin family protein [Eubacteriales bacterium]